MNLDRSVVLNRITNQNSPSISFDDDLLVCTYAPTFGEETILTGASMQLSNLSTNPRILGLCSQKGGHVFIGSRD